MEELVELINKSKQYIIAYELITETDHCDFVPNSKELDEEDFNHFEGRFTKEEIISACNKLEGTSYSNLQDDYLVKQLVEIFEKANGYE